jgi:hypothetical protein
MGRYSTPSVSQAASTSGPAGPRKMVALKSDPLNCVSWYESGISSRIGAATCQFLQIARGGDGQYCVMIFRSTAREAESRIRHIVPIQKLNEMMRMEIEASKKHEAFPRLR